MTEQIAKTGVIDAHNAVRGPNHTTPDETSRGQGQAFATAVMRLMHEATVRQIVVKNDAGHTVMEIPVTHGSVAAVPAPIVTAVAALAAVARDWQIDVYRANAPKAAA